MNRGRETAERAQAAGEHRGGRDAVEVEVAEDDDVLAKAHRLLERVDDALEAGDLVGIAPIALERGPEKLIRLLGRVDAARGKRRGDEPGKGKIVLKPPDRRRVGRLDVELGRHGEHYLTC